MSQTVLDKSALPELTAQHVFYVLLPAIGENPPAEFKGTAEQLRAFATAILTPQVADHEQRLAAAAAEAATAEAWARLARSAQHLTLSTIAS